MFVIFAMFITRSGLLRSVHAFSSSIVGLYISLLIIVFISVFFYLKIASKKPLSRLHVERNSIYTISLAASYISLLMLILTCLVGMLAQLLGGMLIGSQVSVGREYYNVWCYPFTVVFIASLIGCGLYKRLNLKTYLLTLACIFSIGFFLAVLRYPTPNYMANFGLPIIIAALFSSTYRLVKSLVKYSSVKSKLIEFGKGLVHVGLMMILIGVFLSSTMQFTSGNKVVQLSSNNFLTVNGQRLNMYLGNVTVNPPTGRIYVKGNLLPEKIDAFIDGYLQLESNKLNFVFSAIYYFAYGIYTEPIVFSTSTEDYYLSLNPSNELAQYIIHRSLGRNVSIKSVIANIRVIPTVNMIWIGVVAMCIGILISLVTSLLIKC